MTGFREAPIQTKLATAIGAILVGVLLVVSLAIVIYERTAVRNAGVTVVASRARVVGAVSKAALRSHDAVAAQEILAALQASPEIVAAGLYTATGELLARYVRDPLTAPAAPRPPLGDEETFQAGDLVVFRQVIVGGEKLGTIYLRSDLRLFRAQRNTYVMTIMGVTAVALLLIWLATTKLQRAIVVPILELVQLGRQITQDNNYSLRAVQHSQDEIGVLAGVINQGLQQIEERERALRQELAERQRAEETLKENEHQMRLFMEATADSLWNWDLLTGGVIRSVGFQRTLGYSVQDINVSIAWWEERLHPDDRARVLATFQEALTRGVTTYSYKYRFRRKDGSYAVIHDRAFIVRDAQGKPLRALGAMTDITDRELLLAKLQTANAGFRQLTRRILTVQEEERRRISRELHDEAGQALSALKIGLVILRDDLPPDAADLRERLAEAVQLADETMNHIRTLAQEVRPPALEALPLDACLKGYCREFEHRTALQVDYRGHELPALPDPLNICLYRVVQEALTNVARHAQAQHVRVELQHQNSLVSLAVFDDGKGFATAGGSPPGIGLLGMQERLELVGGRLEITSQPGRGTQLVVYIPVEPKA